MAYPNHFASPSSLRGSVIISNDHVDDTWTHLIEACRDGDARLVHDRLDQLQCEFPQLFSRMNGWPMDDFMDSDDFEEFLENAWQALLEACLGGHGPVVRELLEAIPSVDVNGVDEDSSLTVLAHAAVKGHAAVVAELARHSIVEVNTIISSRLAGLTQSTILHAAAREGHEAVVRQLLRCVHLVTDAKDHDGLTALEVARAGHHDAVVALLERHERGEVDSWRPNRPVREWTSVEVASVLRPHIPKEMRSPFLVDLSASGLRGIDLIDPLWALLEERELGFEELSDASAVRRFADGLTDFVKQLPRRTPKRRKLKKLAKARAKAAAAAAAKAATAPAATSTPGDPEEAKRAAELQTELEEAQSVLSALQKDDTASLASLAGFREQAESISTNARELVLEACQRLEERLRHCEELSRQCRARLPSDLSVQPLLSPTAAAEAPRSSEDPAASEAGAAGAEVSAPSNAALSIAENLDRIQSASKSSDECLARLQDASRLVSEALPRLRALRTANAEQRAEARAERAAAAAAAAAAAEAKQSSSSVSPSSLPSASAGAAALAVSVSPPTSPRTSADSVTTHTGSVRSPRGRRKAKARRARRRSSGGTMSPRSSAEARSTPVSSPEKKGRPQQASEASVAGDASSSSPEQTPAAASSGKAWRVARFGLLTLVDGVLAVAAIQAVHQLRLWSTGTDS